jgi:chromosome segregation ATPase
MDSQQRRKRNIKIGLYADGDYMGRCRECGEEFIGDKRALHCLGCAAKQLQAELKGQQEIIDDYIKIINEQDEIYEEKKQLQAEIDKVMHELYQRRAETKRLRTKTRQLQAENKRLEARLEAAEAYIEECPCDYDIFPKQLAAYEKWQALKGAVKDE